MLIVLMENKEKLNICISIYAETDVTTTLVSSLLPQFQVLFEDGYLGTYITWSLCYMCIQLARVCANLILYCI